MTVPTSVVRIGRVAAFQLLGLLQHELAELVRDLLDDEDALHRRAALAGILRRALDREFGRLVEIGILHDDQRIVAAEFEHDTLVAGGRRDVLADAHRAREGDEVRVRIGDHGIAHRRRIAGDHRQHLGRQARFIEHVGERQCGQRRQLGRLEHDAVVGRDRRRELVAHHVERMVERRDRRDHAEQRRAQRMDAARLAVRRDVAGIRLAIVLERRAAPRTTRRRRRASTRRSRPSSRGRTRPR